MAQSSIHVCPVKAGSEQHNSREKSLDYVRSSLSHLNESVRYSATSIDQRLSEIAKDYADYHHKKLHSKATPIREGVVVIDEQVSMADLERACQTCKDKFGISAMQIYIHRDEGHLDDKTKEWKPNLHAHIVFDWYDWNTHTTFKLSRQDTAKMQTIFADELRMERGNASDKEYLTAQQYKIKAEIAKLKERAAEAKRIAERAEEMPDDIAMKVNATKIVSDSPQYKNLERKADEWKKLWEKTNADCKNALRTAKDANTKLMQAKKEWQDMWNTYQPWRPIDKAIEAIRNIAYNARTMMDITFIRGGINRVVEWSHNVINHLVAGRMLIGAANLEDEQVEKVIPIVDDIARDEMKEAQGYGRGR